VIGIPYMPWRRADLNGDGFVDATDVTIVDSFRGPVPQTNGTLGPDTQPPTIRVRWPVSGSTVAKESQTLIDVHPWDARALTSLELIDSRGNVTDCAYQSRNAGQYGNWNSFVPLRMSFDKCWFVAPRRSGVQNLTFRARDASGNVTTIPYVLNVQ
jgi:hypothetical protein